MQLHVFLIALLLVAACAVVSGETVPSVTPVPDTSKPTLVPTTPPAVKKTEKPPLVSPEIKGGAVTFRLSAPKAGNVSLRVERMKGLIPMYKNEDGVWAITLDPLTPELYEYSFNVDGLNVLDPSNGWIKDSMKPYACMFEITGDVLDPWNAQDVPHGGVTMHTFRSKALNTWRTFRVYTPADYVKKPNDAFPILYLLHGSGDTDTGWSVVGRANLIADNLIAKGQAAPMIIVMPNGMYPRGKDHEKDFETDVMECIVPFVEANYRVKKDARSHAMAGLSMGAAQTLDVGINHSDKFAWLGAFSNGIDDSWLPKHEEGLKVANERLALLWIAIGDRDFLLNRYKKLQSVLEEKKVKNVSKVTDGGHAWPVWRHYLSEFLPLLFK